MTLVDKGKDGSCISTPSPTEEILETLVEREVWALETDDGFLIFGADNEVFEPPVCVSKDKFLALFSRFKPDGSETKGPV